MANTLRFKRGLASGIPTGVAGEPLFTTDTFDLYIGNGTTNTRFQKYIASGTTSQLLRGDGSLLTMPIVLTSPANGEVLKYNGTNWVNSSDAGITGSGAAGQVAYFTGSTTQAGNNNLFWDATNSRLGIGTNTPSFILDVSNATTGAIRVRSTSGNSNAFVYIDSSSNTSYSSLAFTRAGLTPTWELRTYHNDATFGGLQNGISFVRSSINYLTVSAAGNTILNSTSDSGQRLQVTGTGYFSDTLRVDGNVSIGSAPSTSRLLNITKNISGAVTSYGSIILSTVQSDVTNSARVYYSEVGTAAAAFTLPDLNHFFAVQGTFGAGSTVTNQYGFRVFSNLTGATNNYGFYGDIASGTGRFNLYMNGTANNYMAGNLGLGATTPTPYTAGSLVLNILSSNANSEIKLTNSTTGNAAGAGLLLAQYGVNSILLNANTGYLLFGTSDAEAARITSLRNLHIGTFSSDSGEKLQVNGTAKITGASTFNGFITVTRNQDANVTTFNATAGVTPVSVFVINTDQPNSRSVLMARNGYSLVLGTQDVNRVTIDTTGAATFTSSVTAASFVNTSQNAFLLNNSGVNNDFRLGSATSVFRIVNFANTVGLLSITDTGAATFTGNLTVDSSTFFVDATSNEVGIGTNTPNSVLQVVGSVSKSISDVKTANYTATATDHTILCSAASGGITITLPASSGIAGRIYVIKKTNASSGVNSVTVDGNGSETIDGSASINLACRSSVTLQCDGSNWHILSLYSDTSCL
jgi:hypothetical protein